MERPEKNAASEVKLRKNNGLRGTINPYILYMETEPESVKGIVSFPPLRQPSDSISKQTHGTCYAHVIARLMRRLIYTFYNIHSKTSKEWLYHEDNLNLEKIIEASHMEGEDPTAYYDYYEYFSAIVYLYFFKLAIHTNIKMHLPKDIDGLNGGNTNQILLMICQTELVDYDSFLIILIATNVSVKLSNLERFRREPLLRAVYFFIYTANHDPQLVIEHFRSNSFKYAKDMRYMLEYTVAKMRKVGVLVKPIKTMDIKKIEVVKDTLTDSVMQLCNYALDHGYTCPYNCKMNDVSGHTNGHVVLIVGREPVEKKRKKYDIYNVKNSWGYECMDVGFMHITDDKVTTTSIKLDDKCVISTFLPTQLRHPEDTVCDMMRDIVTGHMEMSEIETRLSLKEESMRRSAAQGIEPTSTTGKSPRGSPGRSPRGSPARSPRGSPRETRSKSRGGKKRRTHKKRH